MSDALPPTDRRLQAEGWVARLDGAGVSSAELRDFRQWLRDAENQQAWSAISAARRIVRYVVRPMADRFRVVDIWTGETAVIAMTAQDGLSEADAAHTAGLLNQRAEAPQAPTLQ